MTYKISAHMNNPILFSGFVALFSLLTPALGHADATQETLQRGEYLYHLSGCVECHAGSPSSTILSGGDIPTNVKTFHAPNITNDPKMGIGSWTDADFLKAMRDGVNPKGNDLLPVFPFTSYTHMSDSDILAIRDYIKTLPVDNHASKGNGIFGMFSFMHHPDANTAQETKNDQNYYQLQGELTPLPGKSAEWNRGAYLVEGPLHCAQCHTPRGATYGLIYKQWFAGNSNLGALPAPNLTPGSAAMRSWSSADWDTFLRTGKTAQGSWVKGDMSKVVIFATSKLTDEDRAAVINYMMSLPPQD